MSEIMNENPYNFDPDDHHYMARALELAKVAQGYTSPNPLVGCVIVNDDVVVGEGYHQKAGTPHAEVHALNQAGKLAAGATAYVSLEPCAHFGRTPPCADTLVKAGIKRVVIGMKDPNPLVAGRGIKRLKEAGIAVQTGLKEKEAALLNEGFIKAIATGYPLITYKSALTLDGKIAAETGDSQWISNEDSRRIVHHLRHINDVVMVGSETVIQDNPLLTCRKPGGRDPVRLIIDGKLRIPADAKIFTSSLSPCIIATTSSAPSGKKEVLAAIPQVEVWSYSGEDHVPLDELMRDVVKRGWNSILLEGGGTLAGRLIDLGLIDKIDFFIAPKLIGGSGPSPLSGLHLAKMSEAVQLNDLSVSLETGDIRISGYLNHQVQGG